MMQNKSEKPPSAEVVLPPEYVGLIRPIPRSPLERPFKIFFRGIIILSFSFIMVIRVIPDIIVEYKRLFHEVESTMATVTRLNKSGSDDSTRCEVYYDFKGSNKNGILSTFHHVKTISCDYYSGLSVGKNIEILYVSSNPTVSVINKEHRGSFNLSNIIMIITSMVGLGAIFNGLNILRLRNKLREEGKQTQAVVFDRWEKEESDSSSYYVAYAF